ncbi:uncharacterized protein METZ01_LOCUS343752, partial [marine metagenome]
MEITQPSIVLPLMARLMGPYETQSLQGGPLSNT